MKFSVARKPFLELLHTVSKAVAVRTPRPILTGILVEVGADTVVATAYDLEFGIKDSLELSDGDRLNVDVPGAVVLPARQFIEIGRKLSTDELTVEANAESLVTLRAGQFECDFHGFSAVEFPQLPRVTASHSMSLSALALKETISSTAFAASKQEARPVFTGVFVESAGAEHVRFSATDSLRLATRRMKRTVDQAQLKLSELEREAVADAVTLAANRTSQHERAIIPAKSLQELAHILPSDDSTVELYLSGSHAMFRLGNLELFTRIIEGAYVDVGHLIPKSHQTEVVVNRDELVRALERAVVFAGSGQEVQLAVEATALTLATESAEMGRLTDVVNISGRDGADLRIAFNVKNVLESIRTCPPEPLLLRFSGSNKPFVVMPQNTPDLMHVISPMVTRF